jgi:hypothetical protein
MVDKDSQEKLLHFLVMSVRNKDEKIIISRSFAYEAARLIDQAGILSFQELFVPTSGLHTWLLALLVNEVDDEMTLGKYQSDIYPHIIRVLDSWYSLTKESSKPMPQATKPAKKSTTNTARQSYAQAARPQTDQPPTGGGARERPEVNFEKAKGIQQRTREVRVTGLLTRFNEQILDQADRLPEEPSKENISLCLGQLSFSTHTLAHAQIRKIPRKDVIFLAFPNVDLAEKFLAGKAHKLRAFPRDDNAGLPAISMNYHDRFPTDTAVRIAQIRRSLARTTTHASNATDKQPQEQQPQQQGNDHGPQAGGGGQAESSAMVVAPPNLQRKAEEAGLQTPEAPRKTRK